MTAPYDDLGTFIKALGKKGEILKIDEELSPAFEISAALRYLDSRSAKPVLFKNIKGFKTPAIGNLFQSYESIAVAFGLENGNMVTDEYIRRSTRRFKPLIQSSGPVKDVIIKDNVDILKTIPVLTHHERDAGPYFSTAVTMSRDPETGIRGMGIHRIQVKGKDKLGIFLGTPPLSSFLEAYEAKNKPMEVAIAVGMDPLTFLASVTFAPHGIDKFDLAGGLRGKPVELVKCETVDLEVPRFAEFVLEGTITPGLRETEGPFGESGGAYLTVQNPVVTVKCICHRKTPVYHVLMPFNRENGNISNIVWESTQLENIKKAIPVVRKVHLLGRAGEISVVQVEKKSDDDGRKAISTLFEVMPRAKGIIVVDPDIDINDPADVEWAVFTRFQPDKDLITVSGLTGYVLDPSIENGLTSKWGVDATKPLKEQERYEKIAPPAWAMDKVKALLSRNLLR